MKNYTITLAFILVWMANSIQAQQPAQKLEGRITLSGAFALYPLAVQWADAFKKLNPGVRIDLSAGGAGKGMTDALSGMVDIGMVSREIYPEEIKKGAFALSVAKDAVVPVISAANPEALKILQTGLKLESGNHIWITGQYKTWGQIIQSNSKLPIRVYTRSDACGAAEIWAKYFGKKQEDLLGSGVFGDPGLALAVKKDAAGIGFNNIGYAYDHQTRKPVAGILILPLDLNKNGKIDPEENFYDTLDQLMEAIAGGKYPSPPARELYLVTKGKTANKAAEAFLKWILTEGQQYVKVAGYIALPDLKLKQELEKIK